MSFTPAGSSIHAGLSQSRLALSTRSAARASHSAGAPTRIACAIGLASLVAALAAATTVPAADATPTRPASGRIEGTVTISTTLAARRPRFRIYSDPGPGALPPAPPPAVEEIRNVVLYLNGSDARTPDAPGAAARAEMVQRDERFVPHVLPVLRGSTVRFPNDDDVFHNVFSLSAARTFDLGRYPKGNAKSVTFDRAGVVQVFCHIHSDMSAVVLVLDDPHFTTPNDAGRFTLADVPPGEYTLIAWHERIRPIQRTIHVVAGETTRADFDIPLPSGGEPTGR